MQRGRLCVSRRRTLHGQLVRLRGIDGSKAWNRKDRHAFAVASPPRRQMTSITHLRRNLSARRVVASGSELNIDASETCAARALPCSSNAVSQQEQ